MYAFLLIAGLLHPAPPSACTCAEARLTHGWCDVCSTGFVAAFPVHSRALYEAIHPHGHAVSAERTDCPTCRAAIRGGGWCAACKAGYVGGEAYFSQLTYHLVQGRVVDSAALSCTRCRRCAERYGWCETCAAGWVGNVRFTDRAVYARSAALADVLFTALETTEQCPLCAMAMIADSRCPRCRITYRDGEILQGPGAAPLPPAR